MKKSNKILLGLLLFGFGYVTCAQIALHIKYARKQSIPAAAYKALTYNTYSPGNIKHVAVKNLAACDIIFADSVQLFVEKSGIDYARFSVKGDTLILYGVYSGGEPTDYRQEMSPQKVKLYMPAYTNVRALNSNLSIRGSADEAKVVSCNFNLTNCWLQTRYFYGIDSLNRYFDTLHVTATKNSLVTLFRNDHFSTIDARLTSSTINDYHAKIGQAYINADSASVVVVSGINAGKINTVVIKK